MKKQFLNSSLMLRILSIGICVCLAGACLAVERIGALRFNKGSVSPIYLAPGLGSMILFPCPLQEVFIGRSEDLKSQISPTDKKTLLLNLKLNSSLPTNVIARCEGERNVFVFDVFPSKAKHQDIVEIRSAYGGPSLKDMKPILSSTEVIPKKTKLILSAPQMIDHGSEQ